MDPYKNIFSKCLIIDLGSGYTKAGLSNEENPRLVIESMVGHPIMTRVIPSNKNQIVVGTKGHSSSLYNYQQPIKRGIIQNFESTKLIINKILEELRIKSLTDIPILITEATGAPLSQRKKLTELIFENYDASCLYFGNQAVLGLQSLGKTSGCILDIGYGLSQVGCVYNGYKLDHSFDRADIAGSDIDSFLSTLMRRNGLYIKPQTEFSLLKNIKETKCKLVDFDKQNLLKLNDFGGFTQKDETVVLPDGEEVNIGNERFLAPEILFKPDMIGLFSKGVHKLVAESIEKVNIELRNKLYKNIYLTGGSVNIENFANRLTNELKGVVPLNATLSIATSTGRKDFHAWHGASMLSLSNDLSNIWIKKTEYKEMGETVLMRKGF
jgi:centractin